MLSICADHLVSLKHLLLKLFHMPPFNQHVWCLCGHKLSRPMAPVRHLVVCCSPSFLVNLKFLLLNLGSVSVFISKLTSSLFFPQRRIIILLVGQTVILLVTKTLEKDTVLVCSLILLTLETQSSLCGQRILEKSRSYHWFRS